MTSTGKINLSLVDDEALFRQGLKSLLLSYENINIFSEASNGKDFLEQLSQDNFPDIVLLDLQMPDMNGVELSRILTDKYPQIRIIVLSSHFSTGMVYNMLEIGVSSYLEKNSNAEIVYKTINEVSSKGFYYSSKIQNIINQGIATKKKPRRNEFSIAITAREKEVLTMICEQYTNAEIAKSLFISTRTVDGHRNNLLKKFNRKNTAGLVAYAIQKELVALDPSQYW